MIRERFSLLVHHDRVKKVGMTEWLERMNVVMEYIEANLAGDIDTGKAAETACCSTYHLQRIFFAVNGLTLAEYVRRRRLTLAAQELLSGDVRVIDLAFRYGYTWAVFESRGAFPKALHDLQDRVFREWFPSTGYEEDRKPELEVYLPGDREKEDYRCQYWVPIIKKV